MPRFWQPTLFYKPKKSRSITYFSYGKRETVIRQVKRHKTGLKKTGLKFRI